MNSSIALRTYAVVLILGAAALLSCTPSRTRLDQEQPWPTDPAPILDGTNSASQSFVPAHDRLTAIEVMPAGVPAAPAGAYPGPALTVTLGRGSPPERDVITESIGAGALQPNQFYRFTFPPQTNSRGITYTLRAVGATNSPLSLWQSSLDLYARGRAWVNDEPAPGDLTFRAYYDEDAIALLSYLAGGLVANGWLVLPLLLVLFLPGYVVQGVLLPPDEADLAHRLALSFGLSLALVPIAFLWARVVGISASRPRLMVLSAILVLLTLRRLWAAGWRDPRRHIRKLRTDGPFLALLAFVLLLTATARYLEIRDLALPLWVDSVFHTSVIQLFLQQGGIPTTYRPFMPVDRFVYHFGFHAVAATFAWLTRLDVPRTLLALGQAINALLLLPLFALTQRLTKSRLAGLIAMLLAGLVSLMPAFYVSWGRYTQLTGLALLPIALIATLDWLERPQPTGRRLALATVAVSGLVLVHYRVLVYYAAFVLAYLMVDLTRRREWTATAGLWRRTFLLAAAVALLTAPWLFNLGQRFLFPVVAQGKRLAGTATYNTFPWEFLWIRHNGTLLALSAAGVLWVAIRRNRAVFVIPVWVAIVGLAANPNLVGLQPRWLVNNATAVISLFLPVAILGGYLLAGMIGVARRRAPATWDVAIRWIVGLAILAAGLWGTWDLADVINPITVLATADDRMALEWVRQNTPADAHFLINARFWQEGVYTGSDGGYWLTPLTGRRTTLPMAHYIYGSSDYVRQITAFARQVAELPSVDDPAFLQALREQGVTHVYVGTKGGVLSPAKLVASTHFQPLYHHGAAWVFSVLVNR